MIEEAVLQKVLGAALRNGGDFAEVFAEDRRASSAALDDGKVEELSSGRDRGAGIRVVVGETTGYAHTADLTEAGLLAAAEAASAAARGGERRGLAVVDLTRQAVNRPNEVPTPPESVAKAVKVELLKRADAAARGRGLVDRAGDCRVRRQPAPHPRREQRRAAGRGRSGEDAVPRSARRQRRHRHADRLRVGRAPDRVRAVRPVRRRGARSHAPPSGRSPSSALVRRPRAACPS